MTPAISAVKKANIPHQIHSYQHDAGTASYGEEAAEKLNIAHGRVFKTLVVEIDNRKFLVGLVPVAKQLDLKLLAKTLGTKKAGLADGNDAEKITGYVLGGISPLGQKRKLETIIDTSATAYDTIYVSAGRRGLELELSPADLCSLTKGVFSIISK